ncbi:hypothetical protein [Bacillus mycoides]|uniref:hypothetical protein n=1 Tax=Bacillus mycoides TaxID=1405 RepID=UPI00027C196F|nr:hypothetical protein [Bacillus mycoides]EJV59363.1 hypothetical protein IEU_05628 [Bacillus mycoides]
MSNIIKRRHTSQYTQLHNTPLQGDLTDLRAVGLLSHLMSLPADWVIYKTNLYNTFARRAVDNAWKMLVEKGYVVGFYCHLDGKRSYYYLVSDIPFTEDDYREFVKETIVEAKGNVTNVNPIPDCVHSVVQSVHQSNSLYDSSTVQNEQFETNSAKRTTTKEIYTNKTKTNKILNNIKDDDYKANYVSPDQEENESIKLVIESVREQTKDLIITRSFNNVVGRVMAKYINGDIKIGFREYLVGAVYTQIEQLDARRTKEQAKESLARVEKSGASEEYAGNIMFYNFLDETEGDKPLKK